MLFVSEQRLVIVKIVSDSIPKYVEGIYHAEVVSIPGMRINQLTNKIQKGHVILDTPISIIHVGTNDVVGMEAGAMLSAYNNLISQIRSKSNTKIVMSALLPRPVDHISLGDKVKLVNNRLKLLCKDRRVEFLHTFRPFIKGGVPLRELFAINDQGLHLNTEGTRRLRQFFINSVAHLIHGFK
ncbi:MAG: SGNH/GDSL hydrolase family protein [Candidatus Thiodiazotropha taylori]|nr:SGNH/GDSL hydrolase family protein [Candidatus Thiodiazotropha taylori]MCW4307244.1 SGNH/GDSL hydrolase family protein [Candidatus Thiodiazotropha endolucinida]